MILSSSMFSIVIPTYNRAHLIARTLGSVLRQDFVDFEIIVVDDGSNDNTEEVVMKFDDKRIQYHRKENAERGAARNYGAARAKGAYINFFDSDDLLYENHLSTAYKLIKERGEPEFFHLGYDFKLEDGTLINRIDNFDDGISSILLFDNKLSCNGVFLRKDIATKFPFDENRKMASSEDWALWITLVCRFKLHFTNEITSSVINHDMRSLRTIPAEKVVARDLLFLDKLRQDPTVMQTYGSSFKRFIAMRYTFFMLAFSQQKQRNEVFKWGMRAFGIHPLILIDRRFLASVKNSLLKW